MIRLGVIGMSPGNGHPYSWSAIINGYDRKAMESCPFPVIPDYLGKQIYPDDFIKGARVTHIWTQERAISEHVAKASLIDYVVDTPNDMIGQIDALLLARDDHENHRKFAQPFLDAGLPVYVDKPLANTVSDAELLYALEQREAQIYTCSALRYARELDSIKKRAQDIVKIEAFTPKSWSLYAIHIVEPIVAILGSGDPKIINAARNESGAKVNAILNNCEIHIEATGLSTGKIEFTFEYKDGLRDHVVIGDMFYAFRGALAAFLESVKTDKRVIPKDETLTCMRLIEMGAVL
ncbi:MAG TPA: Gfo/Idh/MocA family oxidoreductase [Micavibrio sp.]|nr:Gfo/Idh/MocA family oxidoreductase [Micavibrio sp.]